MSLIKSEWRSQVRLAIRDPGQHAVRDSHLDVVTGMVIDEMWSEILEMSPYFLSARQEITSTDISDPGYIDMSAVLTSRFHRVQKLLRDNTEYSYEDPKEFVIDQTADTLLVGRYYRYWFIGDELWMSPLNDTSSTVDLRYSYLPPLYTGLLDTATVVWPDGFESAAVFETAYRLMGEDELKRSADASWRRLKSYIKRRYPGPMVIHAHGHSRDFGDTG